MKHTRFVALGVLLCLAFSILAGCSLLSPDPTETIKKWNAHLENNQVEEAYALFAKDATFVNYNGDAELKGEDLKKRLIMSSTELKKHRDTGKPFPTLYFVKEKVEVNGDQAAVPIIYKVGDDNQGRIDFHLIKESGVWKIKKMHGEGFRFR